MRRPHVITVLGVNYPPEPTGIAPYTGAMARGLASRGLRTHVVTTPPHYPQWRVSPGFEQWTSRKRLDGVLVTRLRHYVPERPTGVRRLLSELSFGARAVLARWRRPDLVVAVSPALFSSALVALRAKLLHPRVPLVVWVQDLYWLGLAETGQGGGRAGVVIKAVEGWLLRRADRVVVIHDRFARRIADDFGVDEGHIAVVRNWTHVEPPGEADRATTRRSLGWRDDETVVLHAGNMGLKQGLDNVLDAAQLGLDGQANVRFVLMGGGGERDRLVAEGSAIATMQFLDPLPEAEFMAALDAADVLLVNERVGVAEMAVPSKLTSYFSTGRPVIAATDVRGITADEIRAADAGVIVPAGEPAQLLAAVRALADDPTRAARLSANGKRFCEQTLGETSAIHTFATLCRKLIDGDD